MYNTVNELPVEVRNSFTPEDANSWMRAYNAHYAEWQNGDLVIPPEYVTPETYIRSLAWMDSRYLPSSRFVEPVVTTEMVDKQMELAGVDEYLAAGYKALETGGTGIGAHSNKVCFTMWDVFKSEDEKTHMPCIVARVNFYRDTVLYDKEWEIFLDGRREWSIGSFTHDEIECEKGRCYTRIHPVQWFELSNVREGVNPRTYVREFNESAKGVMEMRDYHTDECPLKRKYLNFKHDLEDKYDDIHMNMVEGGVGLVHGKDLSRIGDDLHNNFQDYDLHNVSMAEGDDCGEDCILMVPRPIDTIDDVLHAMIHLMMDEQEAIAGYHTVLESLAKGEWVVEEEWRQTFDLFQEVIADEKNHIGVILKAIQILAPDTYSSILDGMNESEDGAISIKGVECPAGQHSHPGVKGCHDVFRKHDFHHDNAPTDKLDLTDEDINIEKIEEMPTEDLRRIVLKVAKILVGRNNDEVEEFLGSTSGKEFVMMFLELKKRSREAEVKEMTDETVEVSEKEAGCEGKPEQTDENTSVKETEKGTDAPDILTLINSLTAAVASLGPVIDSMNARLIKIEQAMVVETSEDVPQISEEIMEAVAEPEVTTEDSVTSEVKEKMGEGAEEESKEEVEEKIEGEEGEKSDDAPEEKSEDESKEDDSANEQPPEEEKKDESDSEEKEEEKSEEKSEEKESDNESEEKPEEKEEEKSESESEDKKDEDELKEGKKGETEEEEKEVTEEEKGDSVIPDNIPPAEKAMLEEAIKGVPSLDDYIDSACKQLGIGSYATPVTSLAQMTELPKETLKGEIQVIMPPDQQIFDGKLTDSEKGFDPYAFGVYSPSEYLNKMLRRD